MSQTLARRVLALALVTLLAACGGPTPPTPPPSGGLVVRPVADDRFEGSVIWELDASDLLGGKEVETRLWHLGGVDAQSWSNVVSRGYGHGGTFDVGITAALKDGTILTAEATVTVDDLPYDYWGDPPTLVNQTPGGAEMPLDFLVYWSVSADGRYVAFDTSAAGPPDVDTNGASDVYVKDLETGALTLASADGDGKATGGAGPVVISGDATRVAYRAGNLVAVVTLATGDTVFLDDPDGYQQIRPVGLSHDGSRLVMGAHTTNNPLDAAYLIDIAGPSFTRLGAVGEGTWADSSPVDISADGDVVVFRTDGPLVPEDDNEALDLYAYRYSTGDVALVSANPAGEPGDKSSGAYGPVASGDGRYVVFSTEAANLSPRATENDGEFEPAEDIYRKDLVTGEVELVSTNALGDLADDDAILPTISGDGRYVAFGAYALNLAPHFDDPDWCYFEVCANGYAYVKDVVTGRVALVSVGEDETTPDDWDQIEPRISADGRYVVFYSSATNLGYGTLAGDWGLFRAANPLWEEPD